MHTRNGRDELDIFTQSATKVLRAAREEAQRFQHEYIEAEDLLLALVHEDQGFAAKVLDNLGIKLSSVRSSVESRISSRGERIILGPIKFASLVQKVMDFAAAEARRKHYSLIGEEDLLAGLVRQKNSISGEILQSLGVDLEADSISGEILQSLGVDLEAVRIQSSRLLNMPEMVASSVEREVEVPKQSQNLDFEAELQGWKFFGDAPQQYNYGIDRITKHSGSASAYVEAREGRTEGKGGLIQTFWTDGYRRKRLRMIANVKVRDATYGNVWIVIEGHSEVLRTANMEETPIHGTHDWTWYQLEVDIPDESNSITFGFGLSGIGRIWLDVVTFHSVDDSEIVFVLPEAI